MTTTKSLIVGNLPGLRMMQGGMITGMLTCPSICCNKESQLQLVSAEAFDVDVSIENRGDKVCAAVMLAARGRVERGMDVLGVRGR